MSRLALAGVALAALLPGLLAGCSGRDAVAQGGTFEFVSPGGKTDIKDALYVKARYDDLKQAPLQSSRVDEGWLVTNTRFTQNAIRYARCSNLTLVGWDYPRTRGLLDMIEQGVDDNLKVLAGLHKAVSGLRYEIVRRVPAADGVIQQHVLRGSLPDGQPVALHAAIAEAVSAVASVAERTSAAAADSTAAEADAK